MTLHEFHPNADDELNEAAAYYALENPLLAAAFLAEVERCVASIAEHPDAWPILRGSVRRKLVRRFPYALLHKIRPAEIRILAVMNLHRRPDYWIGRE